MRRKLFIACTASGFFLVQAALAETTPENAYKYRHQVMEALGHHVGALSLIFTGKADYPDHLQAHADAIAAAGAQIKDIFPEGSGVENSEALPAVWEKPDEFAAAVAASEEATAALAKAVSTGDRKAIGGAFKKMGETCKGCHEGFREEHDHDHD
ncbi:MAG: c-type cytochrome [Gammaproteobacteria bacterium]